MHGRSFHLFPKLVAFSIILTLSLAVLPGAYAECAHETTEWLEVEDTLNLVQGTVEQAETCTLCGAVLSSEIVPVQLHDGNDFLLSGNEFAERLKLIITRTAPDLAKNLQILLQQTEGGACFIFYDSETILDASDMTSDNLVAMMVLSPQSMQSMKDDDVHFIIDGDQRDISTIDIWLPYISTTEQISQWVDIFVRLCDPVFEMPYEAEQLAYAVKEITETVNALHATWYPLNGIGFTVRTFAEIPGYYIFATLDYADTSAE